MRIDKKGWKKVKFEDVVSYKKETVDPETSGLERFIAGEHMNTDDLHIRSWGIIGDGYLGPAFHSKFENGDILYGSRRTYLKKVAVAHFDGITANTTFVLKENTELVVKGLLPFMMLSDVFTEHSIKNSKGSVNPYINFKDIAKFEFLLPPKDQQARLAELLWAADTIIEKYENLHNSIQGTLESAYNEYFLKAEVAMVPLGSVTEIIMGQSPDGSTYNSKGKGMPLLNGPTEFTERYPVKIQWTTNPRKLCKEGDLLLCVRGSTTGRMNISNDVYCIGRGIAAIRGGENYITDFLEHVLIHYVTEIVRLAVGSTFPNIDSKSLKSILIPNYTMEDQKVIVKKFNSLATERNLTEIQKNQTKEIQKQLINQIFAA